MKRVQKDSPTLKFCYPTINDCDAVLERTLVNKAQYQRELTCTGVNRMPIGTTGSGRNFGTD
jgi:hypothetical protein